MQLLLVVTVALCCYLLLREVQVLHLDKVLHLDWPVAVGHEQGLSVSPTPSLAQGAAYLDPATRSLPDVSSCCDHGKIWEAGCAKGEGRHDSHVQALGRGCVGQG